VIEISDIFGVALAVLTCAVFAVMIWAGNRQH
jgi:threonine/homoserine efflux transporter RhtA